MQTSVVSQQTSENELNEMTSRFLSIMTLPFCLVALSFAISGCSNSETSSTAGKTSAQPTEPENQTEETAAVAETSTESDGKVLRHAVFFKFKEGAGEEDLKGVSDAFAALPDKIPEIIDFQWGTNNSPEKLDDGFTHCFLLTFADEKGREVYLPHPDHRAFGDVLQPHRGEVFVIDYWGDPNSKTDGKELKHAVFFKFKDDASREDIKKVEAAFAALPSKIDAIKAFEWGINNSPEGKDEGFTHCFMVTFDSEEGRAAYLPHDDHQAFVDVLKPSLDKVRVLDFWDEMK